MRWTYRDPKQKRRTDSKQKYFRLVSFLVKIARWLGFHFLSGTHVFCLAERVHSISSMGTHWSADVGSVTRAPVTSLFAMWRSLGSSFCEPGQRFLQTCLFLQWAADYLESSIPNVKESSSQSRNTQVHKKQYPGSQRRRFC